VPAHRPVIRLILNQIGGRLTEDLNPKSRRHRVLLMLDEFPALGRLDFFESALAFNGLPIVYILALALLPKSCSHAPWSMVWKRMNPLVPSCLCIRSSKSEGPRASDTSCSNASFSTDPTAASRAATTSAKERLLS
jgi:hypothetical protein